MDDRARQLLLTWGDRLLVLGLVAFAQYAALEDGLTGQSLGTSALAAFATLPLFWRSRYPLTVLVCIIGAGGGIYAWDQDAPVGFSFFWAFVLALYSVAAHNELPRALLGGAIGAGPVFVLELVHLVQGSDASDVLGGWVVLGVAWGFGRWMRSRRRQTAALEDRAVRLELEREAKARAAVAEERARIARELHDVIAHSVSVMVVQAQAAQRVLEGEQTSAREALDSIETTGRQALVEMRRLLGMLRRADDDVALAPQPSLAHLDALVDQVREAGLPVEFSVEGVARPLPPGVDLSAYRIVQEALTNALRHAGPARAKVVVRYGSEDVELEISDDGRGPSGGRSGHGLAGMRERVAVYGGVLESGAQDGHGYSVRARLPA